MQRDIFYMNEACKEAAKAFEADEVPIGAVLVFQEKIIARAHNRVEELQDASAHAEMICLRLAMKYFNSWRLLDTTLYSTLEPCSMCAGTLLLSRVSTLVWGARDIRQGASGSWVDLLNIRHPMHKLEVRSGIMEEESGDLLKKFFQKKRESVGKNI